MKEQEEEKDFWNEEIAEKKVTHLISEAHRNKSWGISEWAM
jgi:hypothetical protein